MAVEIVTTSQAVTIDGVADVSVSAIAHDDVKGDYYRDIVIFGEPEEGETTQPTMLRGDRRSAEDHRPAGRILTPIPESARLRAGHSPAGALAHVCRKEKAK